MPAVQRAIIPGPISPTNTGFMAPFSVFKFDGGASLQLSCAVDLCEGECNPVNLNFTTLLEAGMPIRILKYKIVKLNIFFNLLISIALACRR